MARSKVIEGIDGRREVTLTKAENDFIDNKAAAWADGANDRAFAALRRERDELLHDTDWWASSDLSISESQTTYRQALRDLPSNTPDPANPTWPVAPGA